MKGGSVSTTLHERIYRAFTADIASFDAVRIDALARRVKALHPLSIEETEGLAGYDEAFLVRFTYESNAIEGSTLTLAETDLVLEGEFAMTADKRLSEVFAARGCAAGAEYVAREIEGGRKLDQSFIKDVHERTALDCQPRTRGTYRVTPVYIKGSLTSPPPPASVRELMDTLIYAWENSNAHPVAKAAAFHAMFENVHPFQDSNGRTGRLLMNFMLVQEGFAPVAIKHDDPLGYKTSLEEWQVHGDPSRFLALIAECVEAELSERLRIIEETRKMVRGCREDALSETIARASSASKARNSTRPSSSKPTML